MRPNLLTKKSSHSERGSTARRNRLKSRPTSIRSRTSGHLKKKARAAGAGAAEFTAPLPLHSNGSNKSITKNTNVEKSSRKKKSCDGYANPTVLSRLILHQQYGAAVERLKKHAHEAEIWVYRARSDQDGYSDDDDDAATISSMVALSPHSVVKQTEINFDPNEEIDHDSKKKRDEKEEEEHYAYCQLPIHMACQSLGFYNSATTSTSTAASALKQELEVLIARLIVAYPAGCKFADHRGLYPLHMCIRYAASLETITLLLTAGPEVISKRDENGRSIAEWNQTSGPTSNKQRERINKLLTKGRYFWESVRHKAIAKRRDKKLTKIHKQQQEIVKLEDQETIWTESDAAYSTYAKAGGMTTNSADGAVKPLAWSQLEQRTVALEQLLTESMQHNHELKREMFRVNQKLEQVVQASKKVPTTSDSPTIQSKKAPTSSTTSKKNPQDENRRLQQQVDSLSSQNAASQKRISELEDMVQDLLWVSSSSTEVSRVQGVNDSADDVHTASIAVSSLTGSAHDNPWAALRQAAKKVHQPRAMFGDTSLVPPVDEWSKVNHNQDENASAPPEDFTTPIAMGGRPKAMFRDSSIVSPVLSPVAGSKSPSQEEDHSESSNLDYVFTDEDDKRTADFFKGAKKYTNPGTVDDDSDGTDDAVSFAGDDDDDDESVDSILAEAEVLKGSSLSPEIVDAWKAVVVMETEPEDFALLPLEKDLSDNEEEIDNNRRAPTLLKMRATGTKEKKTPARRDDKRRRANIGTTPTIHAPAKEMIVTPIDDGVV